MNPFFTVHKILNCNRMQKTKPVRTARGFCAICLTTALTLSTGFTKAQEHQKGGDEIPSVLVFEKKLIASESYESVGVYDVDSDGDQDLVSGGFGMKVHLLLKGIPLANLNGSVSITIISPPFQ